MSSRILDPSMKTGLKTPALLLISFVVLTTGCSFEEEPLEDKRCVNDAACLDRFGPGFVCLQVANEEEGGFCEEASGSCAQDSDCEDGLFCTVDTCEPGAAGAKGRVIGGGRIVYDPSARTVSVYGYSKTFGRAKGCNEHSAGLIEAAMPDCTVSWSDKGY